MGGIIGLTGKEDNIHEKSVVSVEGQVSCDLVEKDTTERRCQNKATSGRYAKVDEKTHMNRLEKYKPNHLLSVSARLPCAV